MSYESFKAAYVEALLWSETCEDENGTDPGGWSNFEWASLGDIEEDGQKDIEEDCRAFYEEHQALFEGHEAQAGHDFCLTRNGHGAGFWDGDWEEPAATVLTEASKSFCSVGLMYVGEGKPIGYHR